MINKRLTTNEYIARLESLEILHRPIEKYRNYETSILHQCPKGHQWAARPTSILRGSGCPKCRNIKLATSGRPALVILATLKLRKERFLKLTATAQTPEAYFRPLKHYDYEVLATRTFPSLAEAYTFEATLPPNLPHYTPYHKVTPLTLSILAKEPLLAWMSS